MKKLFTQVIKYWRTNVITFLISLVVGAGVFCAVFFSRNRDLLAATDGLSVAGIVVLFLGLLVWMGNLGVFDIFSFGFKQIVSTLFTKDPRRDGTFYEYKAEKREKRDASSNNFVSIIAAGVTILIAMVVVLIIYKASL